MRNDGKHLIAGGFGTRKEVGNEELLAFITRHARSPFIHSFLLTVCTGAALAAKAGVLKGKQATTNKVATRFLSHAAASVRKL